MAAGTPRHELFVDESKDPSNADNQLIKAPHA